jgi:L-alanine-DL-glutamate epimerase-like enolase superfamily enzyme
MVEFHSLWHLPAAKRIARALEEFSPYWFEDSLKADDLVTGLPVVRDGVVSPPDGAGLGTDLVPGFADLPDVTVRSSELAGSPGRGPV